MVAAVEDIAVLWELPWAVMVVGLVRMLRWCPTTTMLQITGLSHGAFTTCTQDIPRSRANTAIEHAHNVHLLGFTLHVQVPLHIRWILVWVGDFVEAVGVVCSFIYFLSCLARLIRWEC
jgi:hypothetical protein